MKTLLLFLTVGTSSPLIESKLPLPGCPMPLYLYRGNYNEVTEEERKLMDSVQEGCVRHYGANYCLSTIEKLAENNYKVMCIKKGVKK